MKRKALFTGLALMALVSSGIAIAARHHGPGHMKEHMAARIDAALDAAKVSPAQRNAVDAARDHLFATMEESFHERGALRKEAIDLFLADKIDHDKVSAERKVRQAEGDKVMDAFVQAFTDAHDALTSEQRKAVVEYLKAHRPEHAGKHPEMMKRFMGRHIDEVLDSIQPALSNDQRDKIHTIAERVMETMHGVRGDHAAKAGQLLDLFASDKLDTKALDALKTEHRDRQQKIGDSVVNALTEVHDLLSPAQRESLVQTVKARHHKHG